MSDKPDPMALPWTVGPHGFDLWCASLKGGETKIMDMRGWGYLTGHGHGALGLSGDEASDIMRDKVEFAARAINCHADLVEALQAAEELFRVGLFDAPDGLADRVRDLRRAALAKAAGK